MLKPIKAIDSQGFLCQFGNRFSTFLRNVATQIDDCPGKNRGSGKHFSLSILDSQGLELKRQILESKEQDSGKSEKNNRKKS